MYIVLIALVLGLFAALLFVNFYFRWKVIKIYQRLVERKVSFGTTHIFHPAKMEREIIPSHPESEGDIRQFVRYLRFSFRFAAALIALITIFGGILMYYSKYAG